MHIQTWADDRLAADRLGRALAVSLFLHLLLLWPSAPAWQAAVPALPLNASLRPAATPLAVPTTPAIVPKAANRAIAEKGPKSPLPALLASAYGRGPVVESSAEASTALEDQRSEVAASAAPSTGMKISSAFPPSDGLDAEGLRNYRLALAREARRFKHYPPQAVDAGWEGTAEVRVKLGAGGTTEGIQLVRSSGHPTLDEAALAILGQAAPAAPVPSVLRERAFVVDLPVVFELPR